MKKTLSILLLFSFGISTLGFYPLFKLSQYQARKEIKTRIKLGVPEKELHKIVLAVDEKINWVHKGKEFRYNNHLYDVVKTEQMGNETIYHCINDTEEAQLFSNLDELVNQEMNTGKNKGNNSSKQFLKILSQVCLPGKITFPTVSVLTRSVFQYPGTVTPGFTETSTPPPDLG